MKKRFRHVLTFFLLKPFFRLFFKLRYNHSAERFKPQKDLKGPYLILANHVMDVDPFLVALSVKGPVFYVASDMIFSIRFWSYFLKKLVSPIPKTKYRSDTETIRDIIRMVRSGGNIGVFPEGNATFSGELMEIPGAIAKLVKFLKVPVLFYTIEGGYLTNPRWGKGVRKGKMRGRVKRVMTKDEYASLSVQELNRVIEEELTVDEYEYATTRNLHFRGKKRAEHLESAFFMCPSCGRYETLYSEKHTVYCSECGFQARYTTQGTFDAVKGDMPYARTPAWYEAQKESLKRYVANADGELFADEEERVLHVERSIRKTFIGEATIRLFADKVRFEFDDRSEEWPIMHIDAAVQQRNKLILYNQNEAKTYYLLNREKRNALKYVLTIEALQKKER